MAKNKNMRKYAAVALGILGVAGLSLAAASQLTVTTDEIAVGSKTFTSCDESGIHVGYTTGTFSEPVLPVSGIVVGSGADTPANKVDDLCIGKQYTVSILDEDGDPIAAHTYSGTVALSAGSFTIAPTTQLDAADVYGVVIVIR